MEIADTLYRRLAQPVEPTELFTETIRTPAKETVDNDDEAFSYDLAVGH
jgi:hypothetical protein